jgi:hypothetical protein
MEGRERPRKRWKEDFETGTGTMSLNLEGRRTVYCYRQSALYHTALPPVALLQCGRGNSNCDVTEADLLRVTEIMSPQYNLMWERSGMR